MINSLKKLWPMTVAITLVILFATAGIAHANPFYVGTRAQTATATSTTVYLSPGNATTTIVYDSYEQFGTNQANSGTVTLPNVVSVLLDGIASSSLTTLNLACEFSDNYNGTTSNGDWYQNEIFTGTTTTPVNIGIANTFSFTYASSTNVVGGATAASDRFRKLVQCPAPTRFVRVVITNTGAGARVWSAIIPTKQRN